MTDHRDDRPDQPDPVQQGSAGSVRPDNAPAARDERLAAWLAGEMDELAARSVEREIEEDPEAAARADAIAAAVARLRQVDAVEPPPQLAAGVRARLGESPAAGTVHAQRPRTAHATTRRRRTWSWAPLSAAAALALLGVLAVASILPLASDDAGTDQVAGDAALDSDAMTAQGRAEHGEEAAPELPAAELRAQESQPLAPDLGTESGRTRLLDDVAAQLDETRSSDTGAGEDEAAQAAPPDAARPEPADEVLLRGCRDELFPDGAGKLVRVVEGVAGERLVVGAVTQALDGTLHLVVADPQAACEVVAEQTRPAP